MSKAKKKVIKETEVAARLVKWLIEQGWEVYQEVPIWYGTPVDIVAVKRDPKIAWMIEVKTSINHQLQMQVFDRQRYSPYVSAAVPFPKRFTKIREEYIEYLRKRGIGFIHIHDNGMISVVHEYNAEPEVSGSYFHRYNKDKYERLFSLAEEYKTFCPAGSSGGYLTPFKMTCMNIVDYVREHPGCSLREAVLGSDHHYASDNGAVSTLGKYGIRGVEFRTCLYVKDEEE